ncbi:MAG: hypothetical protein ABIP51_07980 [Bacteroidia bacterium]
MFKGKKAIYILVPLNIAIWGFFIYRFYAAYTSTDDIEISVNTESFKIDEIKDSVTYKLALNYPDPFLREGEKQKNSSNYSLSEGQKKEKKITVVKTPTPAIVKQTPDVKYLGLIKNTSSGAATALVSVNGQSKLIKANETIDGVTFKSFDQNQLIAQWGKEKIVVKK